MRTCSSGRAVSCQGSIFALTYPSELHDNTVFHGSQMSYGLKTTTIETATRIEVKRHSHRPDPILYGKVILVASKKNRAARSRIDYSEIVLLATSTCGAWSKIKAYLWFSTLFITDQRKWYMNGVVLHCKLYCTV